MRWPKVLTSASEAFWAAILPSSTSSMPPCAAEVMNLRSAELSPEAVVPVLVAVLLLVVVLVLLAGLWAKAGARARRPVRAVVAISDLLIGRISPLQRTLMLKRKRAPAIRLDPATPPTYLQQSKS